MVLPQLERQDRYIEKKRRYNFVLLKRTRNSGKVCLANKLTLFAKRREKKMKIIESV